jgi:hypothetical protein
MNFRMKTDYKNFYILHMKYYLYKSAIKNWCQYENLRLYLKSLISKSVLK